MTRWRPRCARGTRCRTSPHLPALFNDPPDGAVTEIEVTDPTHPLFGRRFPLRSISAPVQGVAHAFVAYQGQMTLRLPLPATNLTTPRPCSPTKLTRDAITDLCAVAEQSDSPCLAHPTPSGRASRPFCNTRSSTTSRRSSTR